VGKDPFVWLAVGASALLCLVLMVTVVLTRRTWARDAAVARAALGDLQARVDELEHGAWRGHAEATASATAAEFVITGLGGEEAAEQAPVAHVDGAAFADTVLRETVVKAASLAHGVRRGLAPATRNRIRFEMKQEVRRSRKQRRADLRAAQRDLHARQRRTMAEDRS
jgi:heme exporter protein D